MGQHALIKKCTVCKKDKHHEDYHNKTAAKDGKCYRCKECDYLAQLKWRTASPVASQRSSRRKNLKLKYGIDEEEYQRLLAGQEGGCAICHKTKNNVSGKHVSFSVDHDHKTGKIRGLLCNQCNRGIGMLGDTVEALKKAVSYLERSTV